MKRQLYAGLLFLGLLLTSGCATEESTITSVTLAHGPVKGYFIELESDGELSCSGQPFESEWNGYEIFIGHWSATIDDAYFDTITMMLEDMHFDTLTTFTEEFEPLPGEMTALRVHYGDTIKDLYT
jgi:hypothetical protein